MHQIKIVTYILVFVFLLFLSGFFSSSEMAFVSVNKTRILKNKKTKFLKKLYTRSEDVINTILLLNNFVNILISTLSGVLAVEIFGSIGIGIATFLLTFLIIIFGESIPKSYGMENEKYLLRVAKILYYLTLVFSPVARFLTYLSHLLVNTIKVRKREPITEEEIKYFLKLGIKDGTIKSDERKLVERVFNFDETKVSKIYTPKRKVVHVRDYDTKEKVIKKTIKSGLSRFPVYDKNKNLIGFIHIKDVLSLNDGEKIKKRVRKILTISENEKIDDVLRKMQKNMVHIAAVKRKGKYIGIVTIEDIIEKLFGSIKDEHDKL